jgi:hypothetical protein
MWPTLLDGQLVKYVKVSPESIVPGMVVVYRGRGRGGEARWIVHRVLGRAGDFFLEAGDNSYTVKIVPLDQIVGVVKYVFDPKDGWQAEESKLHYISPLRHRAYLALAHGFFQIHEWKDQVLGERQSFILWKASEWYRRGWSFLGIKVPVIMPR